MMAPRRPASFNLLPRLCSCLLLISGENLFGGSITFPSSKRLPPNRCSDLKGWLEDQGAVFGDMEVRRLSETERAVIATKDVPEGRVLMRIPMELGLTPSRAVEECGAAEDAILAADSIGTKDADLLAIFLLARSSRRNGESDDGGDVIGDVYTSSLPTPEELSHLPIHWDEDDASWLGRTGVGAELARRKRREADFFRSLSERSASFREIAAGSLDRWMWAKSNVQSRGFSIPNPLFSSAPMGTCLDERSDRADGVPGNSNDKVAALFPFADMLNHLTHQEGCSCEFGVERDTGDFLVRTIVPVASGSELTVSYGSLSALVSLLNYGFIQEAVATGPQQQTPEGKFIFRGTVGSDFVPLVLSLDKISQCDSLGQEGGESDETSSPSNDDLTAAKKNVWLRDEGKYPEFDWLPMERHVNLGIGTVEAAISVMSLLRVGVATVSEMTEILESSKFAPDEKKASLAFAAAIARDPICWRNERAALRAFECIVRAQSEGYKYPDDAHNVKQQNVCKIIDREKSVLKHWAIIAHIAGKALEERRGSFDFGLSYAKLFRTLLATDKRLSSS